MILIFFEFLFIFFLLFVFCIFFSKDLLFQRLFSLIVSCVIFFFSLFLWINFSDLKIFIQFFNIFLWSSFFNIHYTIGIDGLSFFFIILTTFLIPLCILSSWYHFIYCFKEFILLLLVVELLLINFFSVSDLIFFYICFEGILLPLFIIIGNFGSRQRRIHASYQLFFYTLIGSFFMLFNIFYIFLKNGSTDFILLTQSTFTYNIQLVLWFFFFLSLSVKVPLFPFHIWLPEAHVEAPTVGSVILAGVLLKMGTYGLLRFVIPLFPFANWYFSSIIQILSFLAIFYISVITLCQIDLKKLIAYSSVAHMGYSVISLFTFNEEGLFSSVFLMLNHGIVSSLLFFTIGVIYDRYKTRLFFYFNSLSKFMPIFSIIVFLSMIANIGFPGTSSFIAEFLIMISLISFNKIIAFLNGIGLIFSAFYSFWIYNRLFFGPTNNFLVIFSDVSKREMSYLFPLLFLIFFFGIYPVYIYSILDSSLKFLIQSSVFLI
jgi:NADH-quinone oxidoreductase subunit M